MSVNGRPGDELRPSRKRIHLRDERFTSRRARPPPLEGMAGSGGGRPFEKRFSLREGERVSEAMRFAHSESWA